MGEPQRRVFRLRCSKLLNSELRNSKLLDSKLLDVVEGRRFATVMELFEAAMDVFMLAMGLGCVWLGCSATHRRHQYPELARGPVWATRTWGLGFVLLGASLAIASVGRFTGETWSWPSAVMRWVAGPLVFGSILASMVFRQWGNRNNRAVRATESVDEGHQA
ncbi:hypothetical protein ACF1BP_27635 [Streptomyces sp. NPDC014735]|uniref:hypothetical protein n=1 Tax=unclassified Streptomyces TaxID=2593676 RepID=UPI0036F8CC82